MTNEPSPQCYCKGCPMMLGYYIGGGQYICWLHAIKNGAISAIRKLKQIPVALEIANGEQKHTR